LPFEISIGGPGSLVISATSSWDIDISVLSEISSFSSIIDSSSISTVDSSKTF